MKKVEMIVRNYILEEREFVISKELRALCMQFDLNYENTKKLLLNGVFSLIISMRIFYMKKFNDKKIRIRKHIAYEFLSRSIEIKRIKTGILVFI